MLLGRVSSRRAVVFLRRRGAAAAQLRSRAGVGARRLRISGNTGVHVPPAPMLLGRVRSRRAVVLPRSDRHYNYDDDNYYDYDNYNYQSADCALRRSAEIAPTLRLRVHRVEAVRRWRMLLAAVDLARRSVVLPRPSVSARLRPDAVASPGVRLHRHRRRAVRGEGVLLGRLLRLRSNQVLPPQLRSVARTSYRPIGRYRRSRHRNTHTPV